MTKQELLEMAKKLQAQAESMPDDTPDSATTTDAHNSNESAKKSDDMTENKDPQNEENAEEVTENNELEEAKQIEPQTNGKITDKVKPGVESTFEENTTATETAGVEQVLAANFDQRFATMLTQYTELKVEMDKMKVALAEILTRIELVQEVTDKVTTVDHDTLLSESIKLLV